MADPRTSPPEEPTPPESTTGRLAPVHVERDMTGPRLLGSPSFFRLWIAQVISSLGDWIGLVAILSLAARVGGSSPEAAIALVMSARMVPGFFFGSVAGVLVDRWNRKRVMVFCDIGRGLVLGALPFVDTVFGLFVASLLLEILTLLWSPAKEASVPNMVPVSRLTTANSLSLAAAYGTFPVGSAIFASLTKVAGWLGEHTSILDILEINQEFLAIYVDMLTFLTSAVIISTLSLGDTPRRRGGSGRSIALSRTFTELREGWSFIRSSPIVRSVMIGLGTGLIGGGMVAPLGPTFATRVLNAGPAGFGLLLTALGTGLAVGVITVSAVQRHLPHQRAFSVAVLGAGVAMMAAASMSGLAATMAFIGIMGVCTGTVYVLGFTLLGENVENQLRGRTFATLYTLSRLCLLISLALAPLLAGVLEGLSDRFLGRGISVGGARIDLPGVRLTLWLGATIIILAGVLALRTLRNGSPTPPGGAPASGDAPGAEPPAGEAP